MVAPHVATLQRPNALPQARLNRQDGFLLSISLLSDLHLACQVADFFYC